MSKTKLQSGVIGGQVEQLKERKYMFRMTRNSSVGCNVDMCVNSAASKSVIRASLVQDIPGISIERRETYRLRTATGELAWTLGTVHLLIGLALLWQEWVL